MYWYNNWWRNTYYFYLKRRNQNYYYWWIGRIKKHRHNNLKQPIQNFKWLKISCFCKLNLILSVWFFCKIKSSIYALTKYRKLRQWFCNFNVPMQQLNTDIKLTICIHLWLYLKHIDKINKWLWKLLLCIWWWKEIHNK